MNDAPSLDTVSVVIPVFNEEKCLPELVRRCHDAGVALQRPFEIVLVDDGSSDQSAALIETAVADHPDHVVGIILARNYGQHAAIMAGFEKAQGDIVVTLDADLQNPPEEIPRLVKKIEEGFDVVGTVRKNRHDSVFRRAASHLINTTVHKVTGVRMHDYGCMLRAYRRPIVRSVLRSNDRSLFIPVLANTFARRVTEIEVGHSARESGTSRYSLLKLINLQFDLLTGMTTFPLRLLTYLGGVVSLAGVGFGALLMILRVVHGPEWAASGVFTLFAVLFTFVGAQFVGMGLLGEYIGRIHQDVRGLPRSLVNYVRGNGLAIAEPSPTRTAGSVSSEPGPTPRIYTVDPSRNADVELNA
jgi:undecaprenyl-phosphate 4-deoxy-4-formamido-L-arabinose transferase